jgi:hypothetical protein
VGEDDLKPEVVVPQEAADAVEVGKGWCRASGEEEWGDGETDQQAEHGGSRKQ